jgi:O-antigen ligase
VGVLVAAAPFIASGGLLDRVGDDSSNEEHQAKFFSGLDTIAESPLGEGLGTSAGTGQRFGTVTHVSENYYLQVGNEIGVIGAVTFVAFVIAVNRRLHKARSRSDDAVVAGTRSGFLGISVAAFFLHAFTNQTVAWTAFGLAGAALGADPPPHPRGPSAGATMVTHPTPEGRPIRR